MKKGFLLYAGLVVIFGLGMFFTLERGRHLQSAGRIGTNCGVRAATRIAAGQDLKRSVNLVQP